MYLKFNPKTIETILVKAVEDGFVFRKAGDNSSWAQLPQWLDEQLVPLRPGKKDSYEFLDFYDDMQDLLNERYGLNKSSFMTYTFTISSFKFTGRYTTNECNEPFLEVHANLPRNILKDILWELSVECSEIEHEDWED